MNEIKFFSNPDKTNDASKWSVYTDEDLLGAAYYDGKLHCTGDHWEVYKVVFQRLGLKSKDIEASNLWVDLESAEWDAHPREEMLDSKERENEAKRKRIKQLRTELSKLRDELVKLEAE